tara:strand:- start:62728 stop:62952 length:225 start_codon:yes stop_codon:yes gene_type:complete
MVMCGISNSDRNSSEIECVSQSRTSSCATRCTVSAFWGGAHCPGVEIVEALSSWLLQKPLLDRYQVYISGRGIK